MPAYVDARETHRFGIDADCIDGAPWGGPVQVEPDERQRREKNQHRHGERPDEAAAEHAAERGILRVERIARIEIEKPAQTAHRRQRHDERLQAKPGDH